MMSTSNGSREQVSVPVEVPERSGGTSTGTSRPDPEVLEKAKRRQFSAEYKLGIVEEANACQEPGQIAALLRREGLYSSLLSEWRRARREGSLKALAKPRGPKGRGRDPVTVENEQLRKEIAGLRQRLKQTETILSIQKNIVGTWATTCGGRNSERLVSFPYHGRRDRLLTGETVPVKKRGPGIPADLRLATPFGDPV